MRHVIRKADEDRIVSHEMARLETWLTCADLEARQGRPFISSIWPYCKQGLEARLQSAKGL